MTRSAEAQQLSLGVLARSRKANEEGCRFTRRISAGSIVGSGSGSFLSMATARSLAPPTMHWQNSSVESGLCEQLIAGGGIIRYRKCRPRI